MDPDAFVCDLSDFGTLRVSGTDAAYFLEVMTSADLSLCESIGAAVQGLLLSSLGEVIDLITVLRTGENEYLLLTGVDHAKEDFAWLDAHAQLENDGVKVFSDVGVEDQSERTGVLVLYGAGIKDPLADLLAARDRGFPFFICSFKNGGYGMPASPSYLLFVAIELAAQVGDFLLEYPQVEVIDYEHLKERLIAQDAYRSGLEDARYASVSELDLEDFLREGGGYVGASALGR